MTTELLHEEHDVALVLGSGLSELAARLVGADPIPYDAIADLPAPRVAGHQGALYAGTVGNTRTLVFAGRAHLYEGRSPQEVTAWVRVAAKTRCRIAVITNAAGAINPELEVGAPCLISDHLNLTGATPLIGRDRAFVDMTGAYDPELRERARARDPGVREGVYAGLVGPSYETPAEVEMLRTLGADLVGMSTVLETIEARALGLRVLGVSVVTNLAAGLSATPLSHEEVAEAGRAAADRLERLLRVLITQMTA